MFEGMTQQSSFIRQKWHRQTNPKERTSQSTIDMSKLPLQLSGQE